MNKISHEKIEEIIQSDDSNLLYDTVLNNDLTLKAADLVIKYTSSKLKSGVQDDNLASSYLLAVPDAHDLVVLKHKVEGIEKEISKLDTKYELKFARVAERFFTKLPGILQANYLPLISTHMYEDSERLLEYHGENLMSTIKKNKFIDLYWMIKFLAKVPPEFTKKVMKNHINLVERIINNSDDEQVKNDIVLAFFPEFSPAQRAIYLINIKDPEIKNAIGKLVLLDYMNDCLDRFPNLF